MNEHKKNLMRKASMYALKQKSEMDKFYKNYCLNNSDTLSIILKTHLYIENCLDEILRMNIPRPQYILDKSFSQKLNIFQSLNLGFPPGNELIENKLKLINKIRNSFAHKLDRELTAEELQQLATGLNERPCTSSQKLKCVLMSIIGWLHCLMAMNEFYPFLHITHRNKKLIKKDVFWSDAILQKYPTNDAIESMNFLMSGKFRENKDTTF